jgi:23S rRNA (guanine745-N1)-methyltransferase
MHNEEYICPLCQLPLRLKEKSYRCINNHSFDQAKEGYVNLLPVQYKHSKDPGDNKTMVKARRAFLAQGFYQPLADKLIQLYQQNARLDAPVLDAGCGEGFYTHQHHNISNKVYGVDIAKNAIRLAAKRYKQCFFSVGTLSQLPFNNEYFAWLISIYAPIIESEFSRVLTKGGYLVTVTPAENHLFELKSLIYQTPAQHNTEKQMIKNLTLVTEQKLSYTMQFTNSESLINLLAMTPFAFKTTDELLADLKTQKNFACQADFMIRLYQKTH